MYNEADNLMTQSAKKEGKYKSTEVTRQTFKINGDKPNIPDVLVLGSCLYATENHLSQGKNTICLSTCTLAPIITHE